MSVHRNLKPYTWCDEYSVIFCHVDPTVCLAGVHCVCVCVCTFRGPILWDHDFVCNGSIYGQILWGHDACCKKPDACTEDQSYGTVHVAYMYQCTVSSVAVCQVRRTSYMGTQHALRVVVKRNTCTDDTCNNAQLVHQISGLYKHAQQQFNRWNRMHVHVTMFVSVCTIITRQV